MILGYCTNIHPGETWAEVRRNLELYVARVKARVAPYRPFPVGLRLSARAAAELEPQVETLREWLDARGMYVYTINGFPYGAFHGTRIKEEVFRPDWLEDERLDYSDCLARILAALLPDGVEGSISTVPGAFKPRAPSERELDGMAVRIRQHASTLARIQAETGKRILLALEPEPFCTMETIEETVRFFGRLDATTREHVGVCFDACHMAVEWEDPGVALTRLDANGIRVPKVQVSAGLEVDPDVPRAELAAFAEDTYLHQVVSHDGRRWLDLPEALANPGDAAWWRIHFHVPVFREELGPFRFTQGYLRELLPLLAGRASPPHLEVETYTWEVLPQDLRWETVVDAVARELAWTAEQLR